jgi:hypothetical protein
VEVISARMSYHDSFSSLVVRKNLAYLVEELVQVSFAIAHERSPDREDIVICRNVYTC